MHQHPRSPAPAAPTPTPRPNSARSGPRRESYAEPTPSSPDALVDNARGLGIETAADSSADQTHKIAGPSREAVAKLNQIIVNYHTKAALIILHARVDLPPSYSKGADTPKVNRWFNVELDETDLLRDQLKIWRMCDATDNRPPPMIIETYLDGSLLTNNQSLVIIDDAGKRWDVLESLATLQDHQSIRPARGPSDVILERWKVDLGEAATTLPADLGSILPTVYKKSIVLFRSLFTYSKFLPAWKFAKRNGKSRVNPALRIRYRIVDGATTQRANLDTLSLPLCEGNGKVVDHYNFGVTDSPAGPFSIEVTYRTNCDFRVDDSEALLSSRFMGADDEFFRPSLPSEQTKVALPDVGSLPAGRNTVEQPDRSLAYGSLSTFHQVGPTTSSSPISTLRAARDSGASSPSPSSSPSRKLLPGVRVGPTGRAAALAMESGAGVARRPSISFQPFKAPPLSASPSLVDPPLGTSPRNVPPRSLTGTPSDSRSMQTPLVAPTRKPAAISPELAISSSTSASPKPAPISRYSSSFSHRRGRPSSGGANKAEDDTSSGKASAASSAAQPGSGLLADPTGASADSYHADEENISEFLKMLDLRKNLLNPTSAGAHEASTRKTTAALNRFQRMRDSNAVLSDSMSSSLLLHRSSNASSKQLSGVPPMAAGTSVSTASSPGKPLSPHTPHTPAIPSRLSFNSIVDHTDRDATRHRMSTEEHDSLMEEDVGDDIPLESGLSGVNAIDIPTSPRPFASPYRRSSSVAQRRRTNITDEDDTFPFGMRSVSLGAEERAGVSLGALRQQELANRTAHHERASKGPRGPGSTGDNPSPAVDPDPHPDRGSGRAQARPMPPTGSTSSTSHLYQPRFASSRARGSPGGPHSLSSASSSVPRGTTTLPHLSERDPDRDGSGSNSGNSTMELRRGSGQRSTGSTNRSHHPCQSTPVEEDEPLLFAMSDFGVSRRSLEECRPGAHGNDSSSGAGPGGSRRGSGRRGAGFPVFHAWS